MRATTGSIRRRRFRRRTVRVLVDYLTEEGVRCEYATTLGACGLFIETEAPLGVGTALKVRFRLQGSDLLHEIAGRVVWDHRPDPSQSPQRAPGMGIEFTDSVGTAALARDLERLS